MARDKPIYRRISVRVWGSRDFIQFSPAGPSGQFLWIFLLTGPHTTAVPGLFVTGPLQIAEQLDWPVDKALQCWGEIVKAKQQKGGAPMMHYDKRTRLAWVPSAKFHNAPNSVNVVKAWANCWPFLPQCALRDKAAQDLAPWLEGINSEWGTVFAECIS